MGITSSKNQAEEFRLSPYPKELFIQGEKPNREIYIFFPDGSKKLMAIEYPTVGFQKIDNSIEFNF